MASEAANPPAANPPPRPRGQAAGARPRRSLSTELSDVMGDDDIPATQPAIGSAFPVPLRNGRHEDTLSPGPAGVHRVGGSSAAASVISIDSQVEPTPEKKNKDDSSSDGLDRQRTDSDGDSSDSSTSDSDEDEDETDTEQNLKDMALWATALYDKIEPTKYNRDYLDHIDKFVVKASLAASTAANPEVAKDP